MLLATPALSQPSAVSRRVLLVDSTQELRAHPTQANPYAPRSSTPA